MKTTSYPSVSNLCACGPARYDLDEAGRGHLVWSETFSVVAQVFRRGPLDSTEEFLFRVIDKRDIAPGTPTIHDSDAWHWRDESGSRCPAPADVRQAELATERDYYGRILPALKRIEALYYDSFAAEHGRT